MIREIKTLENFIKYCEIVIEEDTDQSGDNNTDWFLHVLTLNTSLDEMIDDITITLNIYYKWLGIAQKEEMYYECGIIFHAIEIENDHYEALAHHVYSTSIGKNLKELNTKLKTKYLNVL